MDKEWNICNSLVNHKCNEIVMDKSLTMHFVDILSRDDIVEFILN